MTNPADAANKGDEGNKATGDEKIVADFKTEIEGLKGMLDKQQKANETVLADMKAQQAVLVSPEYMDWLDSQQGGDKGGGKAGDGEVDLNAMSRKEFADHVSGGLTKVMTDMAGKMDEQMDKMYKTVNSFGSRTDVELTKLRNPAFAEAVKTDEGKELFLKIGEENQTWSAQKIADAMADQKIIAEKKEADIKVAQAEVEKEVWSEKPGAAASIAAEKNLSDEDIAGNAYDAAVGTLSHPFEEEGVGIVAPIET